ncbi:MAG: glycosyltransferase family 4 protein [Ruminiclostridium sp.]|nr:glycosyltransferase family 4 protein [Ruminiclostridium sp.]
MIKNKVLFLITALGYGGAETQTILLANGLVAKGYKVMVISMLDVTDQKDKLDASVRFETLNNKKYMDFLAYRKLQKLYAEFKPDNFFMIDLYPLFYGYLLMRGGKAEVRTLAVIHNTIPRGKKEEMQNHYYKHMLNMLDQIIFVSYNQREYWLARYRLIKAKTLVIQNGVDVKWFHSYIGKMKRESIVKPLGWLDNPIVLLMNSCLRPEKKHEDMLEVLARLRSAGYNTTLLLVGDGVQRPFLEEMIKQLELEKHVYITGYVKDVRPFIQAADISVLTSVSVETLSMAAIESMAMSKPLVLSDIGGASELVETGVNGFLYPPGDTQALYNALKKMITECDLHKMGEFSYRRAHLYFDREKMLDRYVNILRNLLEETG